MSFMYRSAYGLVFSTATATTSTAIATTPYTQSDS